MSDIILADSRKSMTELANLVSTRVATIDDDAFLFALYASTREAELIAVGWDLQQRNAFLRVQFETQRRCYPRADDQIVLVNGKQAGRLMLLRAEKEILLVDIAILPEFRGLGIATKLLRDCCNEAAAAAKSVRLHVLSTNSARLLYERLGFVIVEADQAELPGIKAHLEMLWVPEKFS
jgi:ribosomal protein S18 acetylase RimI-like enzyme